MGAAAGLALFQTYRYVLKDRARNFMNRSRAEDNVAHSSGDTREAQPSSVGTPSAVVAVPSSAEAT